ncbi:MAG: hypothetical protein LBJ67_19290 [Planctomycetaceae bacterium]|nr:hypothetical protein [Planctomycetaceae bacterium]
MANKAGTDRIIKMVKRTINFCTSRFERLKAKVKRSRKIARRITIIKSNVVVIQGLTVTTPKQPQELSPLNPFITETVEKQNKEINQVHCRQIPANKNKANNISPSTTSINK